MVGERDDAIIKKITQVYASNEGLAQVRWGRGAGGLVHMRQDSRTPISEVPRTHRSRFIELASIQCPLSLCRSMSIVFYSYSQC